MPATTSDALAIVSRTVSIAPMVLLSVVDHYDRSAKGTSKRVVGVLLGQNQGSHIRVTNSFAVPFLEDEKSPTVWYLDHDYVDSMRDMFKKVNAKERLIGWYHSGPKLHGSDMAINELFKRYTPTPLLVIIDVRPKDVGIPTDAYFAVEEIRDDGTGATYTFVHTPSIIEAEEAEEIGVEHLLRDIRDVAVGTLSSRLTSQVKSLQSLQTRLHDIEKYLKKVLDNKLPINHAILGTLQDIFNLLPNLSTPPFAIAAVHAAGGAASEAGPGLAHSASTVDNSELARAMSIKNNDQLMMIFLSSLIRSITAFHDLINNKVENIRHQKEKEQEDEAEAKEKAEKDKAEKEKEAKDKEAGDGGAGEDKEAESKDKDKEAKE